MSVNELDKYPTRTFAVCGSSAEIAYPAFTTFMKEKVEKKLGMLISTDVASRLHIINGMTFAVTTNRRYACGRGSQASTVWRCSQGTYY